MGALLRLGLRLLVHELRAVERAASHGETFSLPFEAMFVVDEPAAIVHVITSEGHDCLSLN